MQESPRHARIWRFGVFEADFHTGELRKQGLRIGIQQKPLELLEALLANAGEVVTREQLRGTLWNDATFVDFDHSINVAVNKLRRALGDSGKNPRFVETLARHGYRFVAPVRKPAPPHGDGKRMIVVLPFEDRSGGPEESYFCDGLTEEMIVGLGRLDPNRLGVVARMTAMRYKGHSLPADEIGKQLGVDHILEGSVRRSAGRVRITVQLISVREQAQLWAESYDRKLENILDIQRDVARRVSRSLAMELLPARQAPQTLGCTRNAAAHDAYLRGRFFWNRRTEESSRKAIGLFEEAIAADPGYGLAHAGLAEAYVTFALLGGVDPQIARSKTHQAALRALEIDPGLAEAHAAFGYATALFERRWAGGVRELQAAAALNANCVTAHMWYGHLLAIAGRFDDALASIDSALQLDPLSILVSAHKGWILYFARRFAEAEALLATVVEMDPSFPLSTYFLGLNWLQMGKSAQAAAHLQRAVDLVPGHPGVLSALARARALEGRRDEALRIREELEKLQARRRVAPYFCACLELTLGNSKRAMDLIEDAWDEGCGLTSFLNVDPALDDLRANPRFQRLARLADGGLR